MNVRFNGLLGFPIGVFVPNANPNKNLNGSLAPKDDPNAIQNGKRVFFTVLPAVLKKRVRTKVLNMLKQG